MRASTLLLSASTGALIALGTGAGTALAQTPPTVPPAVPTTAADIEAGAVSVSSDQAAPGQAVHVSGTCPTPPAGAALPSVVSVTSSAFAGPETFSKTDPMAFDGMATIARNAAPGRYTVTLTCSNGTATTAFTVTGSGPAPTPTPRPVPPPAPTPAHHATGSAGTGTPGGTGTTGGTTTDGTTVVVEDRSDGTPWGWITAGALVVVGAAGAVAYAVTRQRRRPDSDQPTRPVTRV